jgi:uncharacterized BrkB/YihY/UPF0761 family membrane protein
MWMFLVGWVALIFGALLVFSPNSLIQMSQGLNRMINKIDEQVLKYRMGIGICLIGSGVFLFFIYYYVLRARP